MGMYIKDAKKVKSIFAAVPFLGVSEFHLYGKATQDGTPTPDAPVEIEVAGNSGNIVVKSVGKNFFELSELTTLNSKTKTEVNENSLRIYNESAITHSSIKKLIDFSQMKVGRTYTISADVKYVSGVGCIALRSISGNIIQKRSDLIKSDGKYSLTFELSSEDCYISLFSSYSTSEIGDVTYSNIQVEEGTEATEYEKYKEVEAILQTSNGVAGIPVSSGGNYTDSDGQQWICDEIVKYADGSGKHIQRVKKYVFDDTASFGKTNSVFSIKVATDRSSNKDACICSNHKNNPDTKIVNFANANTYLSDGEFALRNSGTNDYYIVYFKNSSIETTDDFKTVMIGAELYYELAEPIHTPLTAEQIAEIEKLSAIYPANNISTSDDCNLTLLIGKSYKTKKIASAWANKDGVPAKVFSGTKKIVCVGKDGSSYCSKDNGKTWVAMGGATVTLEHVTYGNGRFLAIGAEMRYHSIDGENWIENQATTNASAIAFGKGVFSAVQKGGTSYSTDGENWTLYVDNKINRFNKIAFGNDIFVATGLNQDYSGRVFVSTDGKYWKEYDIYGVAGGPIAFGKGFFVNVDYKDAAWSTDGVKWKRNGDVFSAQMFDVTYGKDRFIAVGEGVSYYSLDGETWIPMSGVPSEETFYRVSYGNGKFISVVNVGSTGKAYQSLDGETWEEIKNIDPLPYYGICFAVDGGYDNS